MNKLSTRTRNCHCVNIGGAAFLPHNRKISHRHAESCGYEGVSKPARSNAPPCRGAGPTGLGGVTPTDTHIKYVFVDVRPLRRFAPPPLQGGEVYFDTPSAYSPFVEFFRKPLRACGFGNLPSHCAKFQIRRSEQRIGGAAFLPCNPVTMKIFRKPSQRISRIEPP